MVEVTRMVGSMSWPGCPYDNAFCESFMKTLKQEEIYCGVYAGLEDLEAHLVDFIDNYYNLRRLDSSLGYRTPAEFERDRPGEVAPLPTPSS